MADQKIREMIDALTEDTSPDLQADYALTNDTSASLQKKVKPWRFARGAKGSDVASASTVNLDTATGDLVDVTGTTTITAITLSEGRHATVRFTGILTLTHGASLVLPGGANITTAAGDFAIFRGYASSVVRCVAYTKANGQAVVASAGTAASTTEVLTGTDTSKYVTPDALAAVWEAGSDIASAGTISVGEGGQFNITGTTTITDIDFGTDKAGRTVWFKFAGALTLTHHATTLILLGGANITTAAGDIACFRSEGSDNVRMLAYFRAASVPFLASGYQATSGSTALEVITIACSDETTELTTGNGKVAFRMPFAMTLTAVRGSLVTAQTSGSAVTVDINESGSTILSTKLTFDNGEKTTTTAATPAVISDSSLADDAEITVDIDTIGDGTAIGLKVTLIGYRT